MLCNGANDKAKTLHPRRSLMKIRANDVELYYERHGNGEPVIFSHGWLDGLKINVERA
jgi:hypothetical protein